MTPREQADRAATGRVPAWRVEVTRGDLVESEHAVAVVLLDPEGREVVAAGRVDAPMLPRSALKPAQVAAVLDAGAELDDAEVALAAGSHSGEGEHLRRLAAMLGRHGLAESDLRCPPGRPLGLAADRAWGTRAPSVAAMNCSGKHAAMLVACRARGWSTEDYPDPDHPLQGRVRAEVARVAGPVDRGERESGEHADRGSRVLGVAVDGCGAPAFATSLRDLAHLGRRLAAAGPGDPLGRVATAMRAHPHLVAGTDRLDTVLMGALPGSVSKTGAEGVLVAALPDGHALALSVLDGGGRAVGPVVGAVLERTGLEVPDPLTELVDPPVGGGRLRVGHHHVRT